MKNHLGSYECKLCLTLHNNEVGLFLYFKLYFVKYTTLVNISSAVLEFFLLFKRCTFIGLYTFRDYEIIRF